MGLRRSVFLLSVRITGNQVFQTYALKAVPFCLCPVESWKTKNQGREYVLNFEQLKRSVRTEEFIQINKTSWAALLG